VTLEPARNTDADSQRRSWWRIAWVILAVAYAAPIVYIAYGRVVEVTRQARVGLIVQHRLWELDPGYQGTPQAWTRFAERLLTDSQLMRRVRARYGELAREIELDYRRDLTMAQGEVVVVAAAAWALPLAALYGIGFIAARSRRPPPELPKPLVRPASSDARYRP
jgi:hypothetical protein